MGNLRGNDWTESARREHEAYEADRAYIRKFRMFFTGLVFAVISFIGSNPVVTDLKVVKILEVIALSLLLISGLLLLVKLSVIEVNKTKFKDLSFMNKFLYFIFKLNIHYWVFFIFGMILLIVGRSIALLCS